MAQPEVVVSVSEFIELVNQTLEFAYTNVVVEGEVTGFSIKQDKWVHFTLKDEDSSINCFMTTWGLKTPIEDGMRLKVMGVPKVTNWGRFSLTVRAYELAGEGALQKAFELLKAKLDAEGLFEPSRKRLLPDYPQTIGLITSTDSEAYKDFCKILNERWGGVTVDVAHVQVQGLPAPDQIVAAINYFNQLAVPPDVLVVIRGGGSLEDLQAFNTETVTRALASSRTPTIVGVGHEGDVSLADLVADVRAATPTDAARKVVPNKQEVISSIYHLQQRTNVALKQAISDIDYQLQEATTRLERFIRLPADRVLNLQSRLQHGLLRLEHQLSRDLQLVTQNQQTLENSLKYQLQNQVQSFNSLLRALRNLDPQRVLARGYAIARKAGKVIKTKNDVEAGDLLMLQLAKDQLTIEVKDV